MKRITLEEGIHTEPYYDVSLDENRSGWQRLWATSLRKVEQTKEKQNVQMAIRAAGDPGRTSLGV